MPHRKHMTNADYVAIAISPALIMTLVGSLVFFLIEVFYAGEYQARLNYAFALFVFAAVLITRIAIEMGSERAALYGLVLGLAMFAVLAKFVEHPSPFSHVINLALLGIVWWCAHKLTWDSTLIDDSEDASGQGLLDRMGTGDWGLGKRPETPAPSPHSPGKWVLYFSLAALPLYGIGQAWIPSSDIGRRQYVFALLLVYVFSALALLVTTSFLGLRRYLRQRDVEMPAPMVANWIGIGAAITALVMLAALLLPRPAAEVAISQVPWQARSPGGLASSQISVGNDGALEQQPGEAVSDREDAPQGDAVDPSRESETAKEGAASSESANKGESSTRGESGNARGSKKTQEHNSATTDERSDKSSEPARNRNNNRSAERSQAAEARSQQVRNENAAPRSSLRAPLQLFSTLGGLAGVLKLLLYAVLAGLAGYFLWKNRRRFVQALADMVRAIRELLARMFGGGRTTVAVAEIGSAAPPRRRTFAEFRDPFAGGAGGRMPPEELVRYTFEAFEAWAADHGSPRSADQTPMELVRSAVAPQTPLYDEARRLVRLYSEVAYASGRIPRQSAEQLSGLWNLLRAA